MRRAWDILIAEEIAENIARRLKKRIQVEVKIPPIPPPPPPVGESKSFVGENVTVYDSLVVVDSDRAGKLIDFLVVSPTSGYKIMIKIDGVRQINSTWSKLAELSRHVERFSAYEKDGKYIFNTAEWLWRSNAEFVILVDAVTVFDSVVAFWELSLIHI